MIEKAKKRSYDPGVEPGIDAIHGDVFCFGQVQFGQVFEIGLKVFDIVQTGTQGEIFGLRDMLGIEINSDKCCLGIDLERLFLRCL